MKKFETFRVSKVIVWSQKWVAGVEHGNSLVVHRVPPGKIKVVLISTKHAVPGQLKPGILKLTIRRGQSHFNIAYVLVGWGENGC